MLISLNDIHKTIKEIPGFNPEGLKQVKVKDGLWIYVERQLSPKQIEKRIEKYLKRAKQCEKEYINRNGGRPKEI